MTAVVVLTMGSWEALAIPLTALLLLSAGVTRVTGWGRRPWAEGR